MIGYVCRYTPVAIIESFGEEAVRIEPSVSGFDKADSLMHPNTCAYVRAVLEECLSFGIDGLILTNCCDSVRRLYDVLKNTKKLGFLYMMDLPRKNGASARRMFAKEITKLTESYEGFCGKKFNPQKFGEIINRRAAQMQGLTPKPGAADIAVMGARCENFVFDLIANSGLGAALNLTCTGENIRYSGMLDGEDAASWYARILLGSYPCMRMANLSGRYEALCKTAGLSGLIYHTVKFCDQYSYEYAELKRKVAVPVLKIETDYTRQCEGQVKTRVEAFIESLKGGGPVREESGRPKTAPVLDNGKHRRIVAGIDSGSLSTNVVIMDGAKNVLSYSIVRTGAKSLDSACRAFDEALKKANLSREQISYIVTTGYGRVSIPFADKHVTEITCHAKGAFHLNNRVRTVIDIGGQDSKVIRLDDSGQVTDFAMNDKCSAGTGRFLEVMAKTLEIPLDEMGREAEKAKESISITSMCTVFAESEVVSLIAQNKNKADIIKGLCNAVAAKTVSLLDRVGRKGGYMMTGGVAHNTGVVRSIEEKIGEKLHIPEEPQITGALGAALIALEHIHNQGDGSCGSVRT